MRVLTTYDWALAARARYAAAAAAADEAEAALVARPSLANGQARDEAAMRAAREKNYAAAANRALLIKRQRD